METKVIINVETSVKESTSNTSFQKKNTLTTKRKKELLAAAGINTDNIMSLNGADGKGVLLRADGNGNLEAIEDDPVIAKILLQGAINNGQLYRRWVMAQVFHGMLYDGGFHQYMKQHGFNYMWKMTLDELKAQCHMYKNNDLENFHERQLFFGPGTIKQMVTDFITSLSRYIDNLPVKYCKGKAYKRVGGKDVFISDLYTDIVIPICNIQQNMLGATNVYELYNYLCKFVEKMPKLPYSSPQLKVWQNAYKGAGAFFTLKNMLLCHGYFVLNENGKKLYGKEGMQYVHQKALEYGAEGWRLMSLLKKTIGDNNIDIVAKINSWRKR